MNLKLILGILAFLSAGKLFASEEIFSKAEKLYREEKYDEAIKIYESGLEENEVSPVTFYNIGNCYFKKSDFTRALLYYERAYKYDPSNQDIQMNMAITQSKLSENNEGLSSGVSGWFHSVVNSRKADYWTWLAIGLSVSGTIFLFLMFFSHQISMKRMSLASAMASFVFSIVFSFFSWYQIGYFNSEDDALIIVNSAEARSEPNQKSKTVFIVPGGMKIKILQEKDGWTEISLNANVGWIKTEELEKI